MSVLGTPQRVTFTPDRRLTALAAVGLVAAAVVLGLDHDAQGRLLAGIGVVVLAAYVISDLVFSPRLLVTTGGIAVRSPLTRASLAWAEIESVHADTRARFGLRSTTLEIDAGETLAVLSRRALGADPEQVAEVIQAFRPTG